MYAVTGITGKVGGIVARTLLTAGLPVRAVVRDAEKGRPWAEKGCEVAIASIADAYGLTKAFSGADGVFLMTPPDFDPEPGFPRTHEAIAAIKNATTGARPGKVVFLSTVGAQVSEFNLLNNSKITEEGLRTVHVPVAFLRAAWFMENASWDVGAAKAGVVPSFLQPLDHPIPMVATADIGRTAVDLLLEGWTGLRIVEIEGPRRYSANDIGTAFAAAVGHPGGVRSEHRHQRLDVAAGRGLQELGGDLGGRCREEGLRCLEPRHPGRRRVREQQPSVGSLDRDPVRGCFQDGLQAGKVEVDDSRLTTLRHPTHHVR